MCDEILYTRRTLRWKSHRKKKKKKNTLARNDWNQSRLNIYHSWWSHKKESGWTWLILRFNTSWCFSATRRPSLFQHGISVLSRCEPFTEQFYKIAACISFRAKRTRSRCRIQLLKRAAATLWQKLKYLNRVKMWRPQIYDARDPYFLFIWRIRPTGAGVKN